MLLSHLLLVSALAQSPGPHQATEATGQPSVDLAEEADLRFRLGVERYREGDYLVALEHLLLSNRLVPNRNVAFNIARTYEQLGRFEEAFRHYASYVSLERDPTRRRVGLEAIERIGEKVALVTIESDPPGATVYVGRRDLGPRGTTPVTLALSPGEHQILLERTGHTEAQAVATLSTGSEQRVRATLEPIAGIARIEGSPAGAEVRLGEEGPVLGRIPLRVELPPGPQELVLSADGYRSLRQTVEVRAEGTVRQTVELEPITGRLVINAPQRDTLVEVNGKAAGFTPAVVEVPVGRHSVRVSRDGYRPFEQEVWVAEEGMETVDARLRSLSEVTAAARSAQTVEEAAASVTLITGEEIEAFGYQNLYQALGGVRGIFQSNDLSYKYLGVRGFSRPGDYGNRLLVTIDGHSMNDDQLGASYVGSDFITDLQDVERIEVVRGPGSALYGSNAFFGVINVVTKDGASRSRPHVTLTADEERTLRTRVGSGFGNREVGGWFSASGQVSQGRDYVFDDYAGQPRHRHGIANGADGLHAGTLHTRVWAKDLTVQAFHHSRSKRYPSGAFGTLLADPRGANDDHRSFAEVRYDPKLSERTSLHARVYLDSYRYLGVFPYARREVVVDTWRGAWVGVEPRLVSRATDWLTVTAGAESRNHFATRLHSREVASLDDAAERVDLVDAQPNFQIYSGYAIADLGNQPLRLSLGGRADHYRTPDGVDEDFTAFNPRAAVILRPDHRQVFKVMGGTAFRAPSVYEYLYHDGGLTQLPAPSLAPERIFTVEAEYVRRLSESTSLTLSVYQNTIERLIETTLVGDGLFRYANTDLPTRTLGVEYELRRDWRQGWMAVLQHSMQRTRVGDLLEGDPLTNAPAHLLSAKVAAPLLPGVATVSSIVRAGSPRHTDAGDRTPWAILWDATLTGDLPNSRVSYGLGVRNLLDWRYTHASGPEYQQDQLPQPGRGLFATVTLRN